jgi:hypothetical protein
MNPSICAEDHVKPKDIRVAILSIVCLTGNMACSGNRNIPAPTKAVSLASSDGDVQFRIIARPLDATGMQTIYQRMTSYGWLFFYGIGSFPEVLSEMTDAMRDHVRDHGQTPITFQFSVEDQDKFTLSDIAVNMEGFRRSATTAGIRPDLVIVEVIVDPRPLQCPSPHPAIATRKELFGP